MPGKIIEKEIRRFHRFHIGDHLVRDCLSTGTLGNVSVAVGLASNCRHLLPAVLKLWNKLARRRGTTLLLPANGSSANSDSRIKKVMTWNFCHPEALWVAWVERQWGTCRSPGSIPGREHSGCAKAPGCRWHCLKVMTAIAASLIQI